MSEHLEVVTTVQTQDDARRIARALVEGRLAACVQIRGPLESTYRWKGQIETAQEWQCAAKTRRDRYADVERAIRELHPYEVPEILAVEIVEVSPAYARWLDEQVES
ncbi:MAG TPA: divalent-cation tolerance protein CutA [Thermoguttaceae bacterium]|nr:divalent-cation tolerance protein CutA [Thermoguttaceae bacterium]